MSKIEMSEEGRDKQTCLSACARTQINGNKNGKMTVIKRKKWRMRTNKIGDVIWFVLLCMLEDVKGIDQHVGKGS